MCKGFWRTHSGNSRCFLQTYYIAALGREGFRGNASVKPKRAFSISSRCLLHSSKTSSMSRPTEKQAKEIVSAINKIMGFNEGKYPKKTVWKLLKYLAVFSKEDRSKQMKGVRWLSNQMYKFSKTDFTK